LALKLRNGRDRVTKIRPCEEVKVDTLMSQLTDDQLEARQQLPTPPAITAAMIGYLKQTKPWARFISILGFIGTGLLFVLGLLLILGAGLLSSLSRTALGGAPLGLIGLIYAALGCLCFFPTLHLFRYAGGIKRALIHDQVGGMEDALMHQRSFWRFVGILVLIILLLTLCLAGFAIVVAMRGRF
jgi:hypothetical protein